MIKVVFCRPRKFSLMSKIFRLIENSPFSHSAIQLQNGFYYHVTLFGKVHINSGSYFESKYEIIEEKFIMVEPSNNDKMQDECQRLEGIDYGVMSIIGVGLSRLLKLFGIRAPNFFKDSTKTFYCSEFVWYILKIGGLELKDFDPELDGPKKLKEVLSHDKTNNL